ncbi:unnamed protein product, partial [marine sediment metagenome]
EINNIGKLKLQRIHGSAGVKSLFQEYKNFSVKTFKERGDISAFEDTKRCQFYKEVLLAFDNKSRLDAHKLSVGHHTLGISFGYRFGKGFKWILTTFNPDFYKLRPGHLLIEALINEAIRNEDPFFDMYYGGEVFYKQQWHPQMIPLKRIEICRNNIFNKSISLTRNALRSNKIVMESARKLRKKAKKIFT